VDGPSGSRPRIDDTAASGPRAGSGRRGTAEPPSADAPADRPETRSRLSRPHKRQYLSLWVELPLLLIVAFSAAVLLRTFAVQPFYIPSGSMELTLQEGDKVLVLKLTATLRSPQRGEVVVFRGTDQWDPEWRPATGGGFLSDASTAVLDLIGLAEPDEKDFIKRVIAVGGDTVACCDDAGRVMVNGISLDESSYVYDDAALDYEPGTCHSRRFNAVTVPEGHIWVMGDHRGNSQDSRCQGTVPVENVIGRAVQLVWPTSRATRLEIPDSFAVLDGTGDAASAAPAGDGDTVIPTSYAMPPAVPPGTAAPSVLARHSDGRSRARSANA
jgi:signal peptidase I